MFSSCSLRRGSAGSLWWQGCPSAAPAVGPRQESAAWFRSYPKRSNVRSSGQGGERIRPRKCQGAMGRGSRTSLSCLALLCRSSSAAGTRAWASRLSASTLVSNSLMPSRPCHGGRMVACLGQLQLAAAAGWEPWWPWHTWSLPNWLGDTMAAVCVSNSRGCGLAARPRRRLPAKRPEATKLAAELVVVVAGEAVA